MEKSDKIYVAGHRGMVGSAIVRKLEAAGYSHIITRTHAELDLIRQDQVEAFFESEKPDFIFMAAARVGGIWGNSIYPAQFIYQNIAISIAGFILVKMQHLPRFINMTAFGGVLIYSVMLGHGMVTLFTI